MKDKNKQISLENLGYQSMRLFCVDNAEKVVACDWYESQYCLKSCKFYKSKQTRMKGLVNRVKFWTWGNSENSTKTK